LPVVLAENGPDAAIDYAYGLGLSESSSSAFNYFYNLDGLGSVSNLTDSTGTVRETYSDEAWGNALTATSKIGTQNKFRFTGQALDPATGLYFLRARYYDQTSGRLLSKDPLAGIAHFPITRNRYTYAVNNPLKYIDPSGEQEAGEPGWEPGYEPSGNGLLDWLSEEEKNNVEGYLGPLWERYYFNQAHDHPQPSPFETCPLNPPSTPPNTYGESIQSAPEPSYFPMPRPSPSPAPFFPLATAPQVPFTPPTLAVPQL